ncbi:tetratricopeptide repeat protein [Paraburkholderia sp. MMS20-SJTR3]|uniref:Tetratricopeptide repeat protein n=1 Tax=Paraburkholderia sejongensis TaxID=2886946 RepID=A0ABS8JU70_9BURK|nr:tetratricopeptide repeat protein [Paraburkholderia sp. MMS20-SJTR3]MCC8393253.1 tetratricopeptide repeat protein [Paraburkholderia sp. MMS20-SJTR3]
MRQHILPEATALSAAGQFADALALLTPLVGENACPEDAEHADALNLAAMCAMGAGRPAQAQALWLRCMQAKPDFADAYLGLGAMLATLNQLAEAAEVYGQLAALRPHDADVHSNRGLVLHRLGRHDAAETAYRTALALRPDHVDAHYNLGIVLHEQRRLDEAQAAYRAALAANPQFAKAHNNLGNLLRECGRIEDAEEAYRQALLAHPQYPEALNNLGALYRSLVRLAEAELACRLALQIRPAYAEALNNLGCVLTELKRLPEAESAYRQTLALRPAFADAHYNLGCVLHAMDQPVDAEAAYREALRLAPNRVEAANNLGCALLAQARLPDALAAFQHALTLRDDIAETHFNIGSIVKELGELEQAEAAYRRALALRPDYGDAKFRLATLLISMGRFEEGFLLYECRYEMVGFAHHATQSMLQCPRWRGEPLAGKSLLVWQEDGLGDMLQFGRYLRLLKAQGAAHVAFACTAPLQRLFTEVDGVDAVLSHDEAAARAGAFDCWTSLLSAPLYLGTTPDTIPPALRVALEPSRVEHWRARLASLGAGHRVGLVWKGNPKHHNDAHRSLPSLNTLAPLWSVPGVKFVSLQKGAGEDEALSFPASLPILPLGADLADFTDTAALISQLDLLICVDTSTAHLAASLCKPCWVLLPARDVDWRWMHERDDSPWYPGTVRLFRRGLDEPWLAVAERVRQACAAWFGA